MSYFMQISKFPNKLEAQEIKLLNSAHQMIFRSLIKILNKLTKLNKIRIQACIQHLTFKVNLLRLNIS